MCLRLTASSDKRNSEKVVVKRGSESRLARERRVLGSFRYVPSLRSYIDRVRDPPSLVLRHLQTTALDESGKERIDGADLKLVARKVLEALTAIHEKGYVYTGIFLLHLIAEL